MPALKYGLHAFHRALVNSNLIALPVAGCPMNENPFDSDLSSSYRRRRRWFVHDLHFDELIWWATIWWGVKSLLSTQCCAAAIDLIRFLYI